MLRIGPLKKKNWCTWWKKSEISPRFTWYVSFSLIFFYLFNKVKGIWGALTRSGPRGDLYRPRFMWKSLISPLFILRFSERKRGPAPRRGVPGHEWRHFLWIQVSSNPRPEHDFTTSLQFMCNNVGNFFPPLSYSCSVVYLRSLLLSLILNFSSARERQASVSRVHAEP